MPDAKDERRQAERRWAEGIRAGEGEAFEKVFHAYYRDLCAFAAGYVKSRDRAREVVQDVFLKIWGRRREWSIHGSLKSYLYQAVRNQALDDLKRAKRRAEVELPPETKAAKPSALEELHSKDLAAALWRAVDELPERRRRAFVLHRQHGLTYAEVAEVMGVKPKTVENQIGRALKFLRKRIPSEYL